MVNKTNNRTGWTKEKVAIEIIRLYKNGEPLNAYNIMRKYGKLYGAARKYFGSWGDAVTASGFNYNEINKRVDEMEWSTDTIIKAIKERNNAELSLRSDYVQKEDTKLHSAAQRYFHSWKNACEAAGYDYEKGVKKIKWSEESIIEQVEELAAQNKNLSSSEIQKTHMGLFQAGCRIFGSWRETVKASGLEYSNYRKQNDWKEQTIFEQMNEIEKEQGGIKAGFISQNYGALYQASRRVFGSWAKAVYEYEEKFKGITPNSPKESEIDEVEAEAIFKQIHEIEITQGVIRGNYVRSKHKDLYQTAKNTFGTWAKAIKEYRKKYK